MQRRLLVVAAAHALITGSRASSSPDLAPAALAADDECPPSAGGGTGQCTLSMLQRKGARRTLAAASQQPEATGAAWEEGCQDCMQANVEPGGPDLGSSPIMHYALDCWLPCHGSGECSWCGQGNACCRYRSLRDPPECQHVRFWPVLSHHTCVQTIHTAPPARVAPVVGWGYTPMVHALAMPSEASTLTFYMYRAVGESDYPPENVNTANLAGIMWYLHNEVVEQTPRKFGITRILRMKVQTKAPQPLLERGMNFGVRYAFDSGACTGPWSCDQQFNRYGYFVGCNEVGSFPTAKWKKDNYYENAIWYSMPGPCSSRRYDKHDGICTATQPGGACPGGPTGRGDCTYSYTLAGEIRVDDLEGILNYALFIGSGNKEYVRHLDRGIGISFWDDKKNATRCAERMAAAQQLFEDKYGPDEFPVPKCDFDYAKFYH